MTPRHVLFVEANEDGTVGGSHQVLYDMVRVMDRSLVEPTVLFYQDNRFSGLLRDAGIRVITWDAERRVERSVNERGGVAAKVLAIPRAILTRRRFIRDQQVDLIHMNNSPRVGHDDWMPAARLCGIPIVTSARGDAAALPTPGVRGTVHRWLMKRFDRVLCVSEYIATAMRAQGMPPAAVQVVHDGVDRAKLSRIGTKSAQQIRAELQVPDDRVFVAMIGNIRDWKGQHVVLQALATLGAEDLARLCVVFVGMTRPEDEPYHASLREMVQAHGLHDAVRFAGVRTDVPDILSVADCMVHASVLAEPGGTVVIEAMTFGAPVIVASHGGHLDYLQEGLGLRHDVAQPTQLAAHLRHLAQHPDERARMSAGSKVRAAEFSIEATAQKMQRVYGELLGMRPSATAAAPGR
jgi:glycosyltransferase involved in cell wall biosynthesis